MSKAGWRPWVDAGAAGPQSLFGRLYAGVGRAAGGFDEAIQELAELLDLGGVEAGDDLGVAAFDHEHHALPDPFALGCKREHHAAAVDGTGFLADQALLDQRLRGATGLALVRVGALRQVVDGQRAEGADGSEASAFAERNARAGLVGLLGHAVGAARES